MEQETDNPDTRIQVFLAMLGQQPNDADCRRCLSQLHDYASAQQAGDDYRTQFSWTVQHLDSCVACAEVYGFLYEMIMAEVQGDLALPESIPPPDLSFLTAVSDLTTLLAQAIRQTHQHLTIQLNDVLNALLAPAPQVALTRSSGEGRYGQKLLELAPEQVSDLSLPLTLTVYADQEHPDLCLIEVIVEPPGMSWPDLGGYEVTITVENQSLTAKTDEWGTAVFLDTPITSLNKLLLDVNLDNPL